MVDLQWNIVNLALSLILILYLQWTSIECAKSAIQCPIGFDVALTKTKEPICYSLKKNPETFRGKFKNCTGNRFTIPLYNSLSLPKSERTIWTDYKSLYPGGPFVDWSYTSSTGDILETTYEVNRDVTLSVEDELCVAIDPVNNFTTVRCDEMHYRYCFVNPYFTSDESDDGCEDLTDGLRFFDPMPACLTAVAGEGGKSRGLVRATWSQSQKLCEKRGGSLLSRGWRYSNYFKASGMLDTAYPMIPLNVVFNPEHTSLRYGEYNDSALIPETDWHFDSITSNETSFGAIRDDFWYLVNSSYIFYNVICEKPIQLRHVNLTVEVNSGDKLITLTVNDTLLQEDDIYCLTDSSRYYPQKVSVKAHPSNRHLYVLKAIENGYYWCTHVDSKNFYISESNRALYVKVKDSTENLYAVKIRLFDNYELDSISRLLDKVWKKKLEEYVFYSTKYMQVYESSDTYDNYTIMNFRNEHRGLDWRDRDIIQKLKLKRLYLDAKTALLHVELHPDMKPVKPGQWESIVFEYMKPAYYCDKPKDLALGMTRSGSDCKVYTCVGDYNEGVQMIITSEDTCYTPATVTLRSAVNVSDVTPLTPTGTTVADFILESWDRPYVTTPTPRERSGSDSSEEFHYPTPTLEFPNVTHPEIVTEVSTSTEVTTLVTETTYSVSTVSNEVLTITAPTKPPKPPKPITTPAPTEQPTTVPTLPPTRPPPDQQLQQVIEDLEGILHNSTEPVMVEDIDDTFTQVNDLLEYEDVEIPGNLLHLLDELGARIDLNGTQDATTVRDNIALVVADAQPEAPVRGLRIAAPDTGSNGFNGSAFEILRDEVNSTHLAWSESEVVVQLPPSVSEGQRRVSFVVFRDDRAFQPGHDSYAVNSRVLSVNIENTTVFHDGEVIDIHLMPMTSDLERNESRACAFWKFQEDGLGGWSEEGCTFIRAREAGRLDTCRCDHLTHFAEILVPRSVFSEANEAALEVITIVGCCLSILGLLLVALTAALFRSWRREYSNKIWLQLSVSILLLSVCFLTVVFVRFEGHEAGCAVAGAALHYSVLASFCWMVVAAVLSYQRLVVVFSRDASHKLLRAAAFAWGAPCAVLGILLSISPRAYSAPFEDMSPSGAFCYPSGLALWLAVYAPIALMLLANWTLFALIVRSVFASRRIQRHGDTNEALRCASVSCLLVFLFGLPWVFGLFAFNVVAAYFFTILATFQGFVLFVFFVLGNKKTRDLWLNKLRIKRSRKIPVTSSTYTNRSTGAVASEQRRNQTPASIEANNSKPKSLSSSDNSRFS